MPSHKHQSVLGGMYVKSNKTDSCVESADWGQERCFTRFLTQRLLLFTKRVSGCIMYWALFTQGRALPWKLLSDESICSCWMSLFFFYLHLQQGVLIGKPMCFNAAVWFQPHHAAIYSHLSAKTHFLQDAKWFLFFSVVQLDFFASLHNNKNTI